MAQPICVPLGRSDLHTGRPAESVVLLRLDGADLSGDVQLFGLPSHRVKFPLTKSGEDRGEECLRAQHCLPNHLRTRGKMCRGNGQKNRHGVLEALAPIALFPSSFIPLWRWAVCESLSGT
jgi:hypothetical protein